MLNFYGITGTLGDENTKKVFQNEFFSHIMIMPTYIKKICRILSILCKDKKEYFNIICREVDYQAKNHRKILVINSTIKDAIKSKDALKYKNSNYKISLYTRDDYKKERESLDNEDNQIILSTNLAGRGTDIKTKKIKEEYGGLHIILTYMSNNLIVEKQAFGRTSRQENKGSGQMILLNERYKTITEFREKRDLEEKISLDEIKEK